MANKIVFRYDAMSACVQTLQEIMGQYQSAAEKFQTDFTTAVTEWEGDSKEKMQMFIAGAVNDYLAKTIPSIVEALATILQENAEQMKKADEQIAENIPSSLGGE